MGKNKNIKTNTPKDQALKDHLEYIKEQFQIEKEVVIGMAKTEERINLDALAL